MARTCIEGALVPLVVLIWTSEEAGQRADWWAAHRVLTSLVTNVHRPAIYGRGAAEAVDLVVQKFFKRLFFVAVRLEDVHIGWKQVF